MAPSPSTHEEFKLADEKSSSNYLLPDGVQMKISHEKQLAPEILFQPDKIGLEYPGVHEMVVNAIR